MKMLFTDGFGLMLTQNKFTFVGMDKEDKECFFQYDGENVIEISKDSYYEYKLGKNWAKILDQFVHPNIAYIEQIANCYIHEDGVLKLKSLTDCNETTLGADWKTVYNVDLFPNDLLTSISSCKTCFIEDEMICLLWPHNIVLHFNKLGDLVQYIMLGANDYCDTLYEICSDGQAIWGVYPTMNSVAKYKFPSFEIEKIYHYTQNQVLVLNKDLCIIVSENELNGINYPENITYMDGQYFICDMENERIATLNPTDGKIEAYINLELKPFEFFKSENQMVVVSEEGIYLL